MVIIQTAFYKIIFKKKARKFSRFVIKKTLSNSFKVFLVLYLTDMINKYQYGQNQKN